MVIRYCFERLGRRKDELPHRTFSINDREANAHFHFVDNHISTSKYTWWSYLPRGLFEQFRRAANIYFLIQSALSLTPLSPLSPITTLGPLTFVVGVAMLKELYEDVKRGLADYEMNNRRITRIMPDGTEHTIRWREVRVGDIIKSPNNDFFCADLLCLSSSRRDGAAYVETMNLDGETNLKHRLSVHETHGLDLTELLQAVEGGKLQCELPNASIYTFVGQLELPGNDTSINVSPANFLLRGSKLRNTDYAIGLVVYTGQETKIMMNSTRAPSKRSQLEHRLDMVILVQLGLQFLACLVTAIVYAVYLVKYNSNMWYLAYSQNYMLSGIPYAQYNYMQPVLAGFLQFFSALVLYIAFVPISLYVTMEIVKVMQALFISLDQHMVYEDKDIPCTARTSNLNEDLGMVQTILSDKTGTLTRNQMDFIKCSIAGTSYGVGSTEVERAAAAQAGRPVRAEVDEDSDDEPDPADGFEVDVPVEKGYNMKDPKLDHVRWRDQPTAPVIHRFLQVLALCHTVTVGDVTPTNDDPNASNHSSKRGGQKFTSNGISSRNGSSESLSSKQQGQQQGMSKAGGGSSSSLKDEGSGDADTSFSDRMPDVSHLQFFFESPDESAFVVAARRLGLCFMGRDGAKVKVREYGRLWREAEDVEYELLCTVPFTSARKRMSVVVRPPSGPLLLLCKGADSVIMPRCETAAAFDVEGEGKAVASEAGKDRREATERHITAYAEGGLRTLALAYREVDEQEFAAWQTRWQAMKASALEGDKKKQAEQQEALAEELERGLVLLGATGIEDKLQVGVPQAIAALAEGGIRLWVLTGDKVETAVNIGFACSLLRHDMQLHSITLEDNEVVSKEAHDKGLSLSEYASAYVHNTLQSAALAASKDPLSPHALIIDGAALTTALSSPTLRSDLLELGLRCASVLCCRTSPKQKAEVTSLVRHEGRQITLAVGDGANDVGMIQKANLGVGIAGEEGQQAKMAADFSIGQFRFLERLLLVHGGWSYRRTSLMIKYFFYKASLFVFSILIYNALALFSGTSIYNDWYITLYQVIFTALPVMAVGVLDQDVKPSYRLRFPYLYQQSQQNRDFQWYSTPIWLLLALTQSIILTAVCVMPYGVAAASPQGRQFSLLVCGTVLYTCVIVTVSIQISIVIQYWTILHHLAIWVSIIGWFLFLVVSSFFPFSVFYPLRGLWREVLSTPVSYFTVLLGVGAACFIPVAAYGLRRHLAPYDYEVVQEIRHREKHGKTHLGPSVSFHPAYRA